MSKQRLLGEIFFQAMRQGYAKQDVSIKAITGLPGSAVIEYQDGHYRLIDYWIVGANGKSFGDTLIYNGGALMWMMHYWGEYADRAIDILKFALRSEYLQDGLPLDPPLFNGCRGPRILPVGDLTYVNMPDKGSSFSEFSGREEIFDKKANNASLGWHRYHGCMMV